MPMQMPMQPHPVQHACGWNRGYSKAVRLCASDTLVYLLVVAFNMLVQRYSSLASAQSGARLTRPGAVHAPYKLGRISLGRMAAAPNASELQKLPQTSVADLSKKLLAGDKGVVVLDVREADVGFLALVPCTAAYPYMYMYII